MNVEHDAKVRTFSTGEADGDKEEEDSDIVDYSEGCRRFIENHDLIIDERFEYPRNGTDPGLVLIFNQESFEHHRFRNGSRRDVNELTICLGRLGYNISRNNVFNDLDSKEILHTLDEILKADLSQMNCVMVVFLTHGDRENKLYCKRRTLDTSAIWQKFVHCEQLNGKPKLFLFQACKGHSYSATEHSKRESRSSLVPACTFSSNYLGPDLLIVYATIEDNLSYRYPSVGSWFIQELCKNFLSYGRRDDVTSLIIRTTKCVTMNHFEESGTEYVKQLPVFISTLTKKFYLNRSKERSFLLEMQRKCLENQLLVMRLEEKINEMSANCAKDKKNKFSAKSKNSL